MAAEARERPWIGVTLGDPAGIGPEVCAKALEDAQVRESARFVSIGPASFRPAGAPAVDVAGSWGSADHVWIESACAPGIEIGRPQRAGGEAALAALRVGVDLAMNERVGALVTAPVSKEALHLAGERVEGQTELLGRWAGVARFEMIAIAGELRVMLASRHVPLARAVASITIDGVADRLELLDRTLKQLGFATPKVALAGLNPHAGEAGILGREEIDVLEPAARRARVLGVDVVGPLSPDSVFLRASRGAFDGVLALYHDQAFIPVKLLAPETGLTLIAGLPFLRISPAHGTAFDIAGRGVASPKNMIVALRQAAVWARARAAARPS